MRRLTITIGFLTLIFIVGLIGVGEALSAPARRIVGSPPPDLSAESVILAGSSSEAISGWFARGKPGTGAVLLLHGIRSDRRQMLDRSKFLNASGYSVLLIDLPAHGESAGDRITFGYREAEGVRASMRFFEETLPGETIGVIGVSLGAASLVLSGVTPIPNAIVLESMYPTIDEAVSDRLRIRAGSLGAIFTPLLIAQLPIRLGISADQLRPIDRLSGIRAPILIVSGTEDRHTTTTETKRLFEAALQPKELWLVEGAGHVDLYNYDPKTYELKISGFLGKYLVTSNSVDLRSPHTAASSR